ETKEAAPVTGKPWTRHYDPDVPASLVYPIVPLQAMPRRRGGEPPELDRDDLLHAQALVQKYLGRRMAVRQRAAPSRVEDRRPRRAGPAELAAVRDRLLWGAACGRG